MVALCSTAPVVVITCLVTSCVTGASNIDRNDDRLLRRVRRGTSVGVAQVQLEGDVDPGGATGQHDNADDHRLVRRAEHNPTTVGVAQIQPQGEVLSHESPDQNDDGGSDGRVAEINGAGEVQKVSTKRTSKSMSNGAELETSLNGAPVALQKEGFGRLLRRVRKSTRDGVAQIQEHGDDHRLVRRVKRNRTSVGVAQIQPQGDVLSQVSTEQNDYGGSGGRVAEINDAGEVQKASTESVSESMSIKSQYEPSVQAASATLQEKAVSSQARYVWTDSVAEIVDLEEVRSVLGNVVAGAVVTPTQLETLRSIGALQVGLEGQYIQEDTR